MSNKYLKVVNELAVQMLKATEFPDDSRSVYKIWEQETNRTSRQFWEDRAEAVITGLGHIGIDVEER